MSVNGNEEPRWRDLSPIQFSCNCNYSLITHNKAPVHSTWGLLSVCAACPTPRLNLSSELRPSWEQHPRYVPHRVRNEYNISTRLVSVTMRRVAPSEPYSYEIKVVWTKGYEKALSPSPVHAS